MSALGIAALVAYGTGFVIAFVMIARWSVADDAAIEVRSGRSPPPDWLSGLTVGVGALLWPVVAVCWFLGRLYTVAGGAR